ncbi:MAG: DEAD/DEAH box helicase [Tessaracoccus sp.]|uniref:DEAD/DEAH box helicase n=1 Tax=Tessaracoccus sp. TaxID=1971211 RepID=UPI001ED6B857|nr:DEAD/DEAH box helicase [Tessaracoccus sp.]MBK7823494.1 DEAD/DEAH box helicase [Tessaracoccus sp.]
MIPWVVARELRATLLDYLRSTWGIADRRFEAALFDFLAGPQGLFQGPYLRLGLPFAPAPADAAIPLDVAPPYPPHLHQLQAWQRLSSRGQTPQATLITTGTGSGKTECFLFPLLDHAARARAAGQGGIKAIVLYPMNALAADQAGRFADTIHRDERLRGLRVGLFVGGQGQHKEMGRDHVIDDNDRLRAEPPDILLTNYRMLDLLLQRPKDASLWKLNQPSTLRYLVLDELHTYDGAQGTDVACLIRRLGQRLGSAEALCPVGTSATVGTGDETRAELLRFASTLFDQTFAPEAFIGETRLEPAELVAGAAAAESYPEEPGPWPEAGESIEVHLRRVVRAWLPRAAQGEVIRRDGGTEQLDRVALGRWVRTLPIVRTLLAAAHRRPLATAEVDGVIARALPRFAAGTPAQRSGWLAAALTLVSYAQREAAGHVMPLVSVQATLWVREVRRLLARVGTTPTFRFHDDAPPPDDEPWAPPYACRECGHTGWLITEAGPGDAVGLAYKEVARAYSERASTLRVVHVDDELVRHIEAADGVGPRVAWLDPDQRRLLGKAPEDRGDAAPRVYVHAHEGNVVRCPACGGDGPRLLAARSTTLSSVAVGHLYTTPLNTDRKLLTFSDSVQDAAHRAGFYGARTYRFALRSAMLAAVPHGGARIALADLGDATWDHWLARLGDRDTSATAALTAVVLPTDLHWLGSVEEWHERLDELVRRRQQAEEAGEPAVTAVPEPSPRLVADVRARLRWECSRELGVAARIGRTLEQSGCVSVTVDSAKFATAVEDARAALRDKVGLAEVPSEAAMARFLGGLVTRLRLRGGVFDPLLERYVASGGNAFMLTKQMTPLMSPFARGTGRPTFLTSAPRSKQFDSVTSERAGAWTVDWVARALGLPLEAGLAAEVYRAVLPALVRHGVLRALATDERDGAAGKATAWGLEPTALQVSRAHVARRCDACSGEVTGVESSPTDLRDGPCLRFRCPGSLRALPPRGDHRDDDGLPVAGYYKRFYEREALGRLWSREHTGLLPRDQREELELEFKQRPRPDSPNLLSCTPTLEMGIDIGDLSATLLCSVPPSTGNYVQRVGRAGRKTGNALVLAFAATKPHDLYFFEAPLEAMAGAIQPPGCYLSAPEVLKRQALAFLFDAYAREGGKLAGQVGDVLKGDGAGRFPLPFLEFVAPRRARLQAAFLEMFKGELTPGASEIMRAAFTPGADGLAPLERDLVATAEATRRRREDLRRLVQRLDERIKQLDTDEVEAKKVADVVVEKQHLRDERAFVNHQLKVLREQDVWGWLCDESRLPNYAFPERGVKLDAYIRREGTGRDAEHHTWIRPPATALTELAPFNTFYASARRVRIDGVEVSKEAPPSLWRFCQSCHYARPHTGAAAPEPQCPACGDARWPDVGQAREVLSLGQVFANTHHRDAVLNDNADEREHGFYQRVRLFETQAAAREAWANDSAGFGFELQPQMVQRQLNLGPADDKAANVQLAGQTVPDVRFTLCATCGQAQDSRPPRPDEQPRPRHRAWCPERKKPDDKQASRQLHLMRELRSEALRLVVPIVGGERVEADLANLRAALRVGLRRFYGGDPDFLEVVAYDEPLAAGEGRRRFLVIMDRVPGGTGLLAELCLDKGTKLKDALTRAYEVLRTCPCQHREPAARACYQCLYAYREGADLPMLDRARALDIVAALLDGFTGLQRVDSIGTMNQSAVLESELEERFVAALAQRVRDGGGAWERQDERTWHLTVGKRRWLLRAQVELTSADVAVPCRPDFMLYPEQAGVGARKVAVFCDGLTYHVVPGAARARLADDARKRHGISVGGDLLSWSLTWKDVVSPEAPAVPRWFGDGARFASLQALAFKLDEARPEKVGTLLRVLDADPLAGLVAYLEAPTRLGDLAAVSAMMLLSQAGKRQPADRVASAHQTWRQDPTPGPLPLLVSEGDTATARLDLGGHGGLLVSAAAVDVAALLAKPDAATVTVRLEDDAPARSAPTYELAWRQWLRAWNLLQAVPGAALVTGVGASELEPVAAPAATVAPPAAPAAHADDPRLVTVREVGDVDAVKVLTSLIERYPGLEAPAVPFELRAPAFAVSGDVEVGWPTRKVAAHLDHQAAEAAALAAAGWTVFLIERGVTVEALAAALGLGEAR